MDDKQDVRRKWLIMLLIRSQGFTRKTLVQHTFCHFKALNRSNIFVQHCICGAHGVANRLIILRSELPLGRRA